MFFETQFKLLFSMKLSLVLTEKKNVFLIFVFSILQPLRWVGIEDWRLMCGWERENTF